MVFFRLLLPQRNGLATGCLRYSGKFSKILEPIHEDENTVRQNQVITDGDRPSHRRNRAISAERRRLTALMAVHPVQRFYRSS